MNMPFFSVKIKKLLHLWLADIDTAKHSCRKVFFFSNRSLFFKNFPILLKKVPTHSLMNCPIPDRQYTTREPSEPHLHFVNKRKSQPCCSSLNLTYKTFMQKFKPASYSLHAFLWEARELFKVWFTLFFKGVAAFFCLVCCIVKQCRVTAHLLQAS